MQKMDKKETIQNKTAPGHKYNVKFSYFKDLNFWEKIPDNYQRKGYN